MNKDKHRKGLFIALEGVDGSGKTLVINKLKSWFKKNRPDTEVVFAREPGGLAISEKIRKLILDQNNKMNETTELLLYAASRAELVEKIIKPALQNNKLVVCDRYVLSSLAYQGYGRNIGWEKVWKINEIATQDITPNLNIFLDINPIKAIERTHRKNYDRLETSGDSFKWRVYKGYLDLEKNIKNIKNINALNKKNIVFKEVLETIMSLWEKNEKIRKNK